MIILNIKGRQIYDSRGNPTVEVDIKTKDGIFRGSVSSGVVASEVFEALELRDNTNDFQGKGVEAALRVVNKVIRPELVGKTFVEFEIDNLLVSLDGTDDKSKYGVNSLTPVSMAVARAWAAEKKMPLYLHIAELLGTIELNLPFPVFNLLNGGIHAHNNLAMQEFLIIPRGAESFSEAMRMGVEVFHCLKNYIKDNIGLDATNVGDEGAFSLHLNTTEEALDLLVSVIKMSGHQGKITLGIDVAASEFYQNRKYNLNFKDKQSKPEDGLTSKQLHAMYLNLIKKYPITLLEDPFHFEDYASFARLTAAVGHQVSIMGDDLTVTSEKRMHQAVKQAACNGILVKLNQIGTVVETLKACQIALVNEWSIMVSHRSGETVDTFISDLAVGASAEYIKAGAPCRSERMCKYNQLLRIEEELGPRVVFARGRNVRGTEM